MLPITGRVLSELRNTLLCCLGLSNLGRQVKEATEILKLARALRDYLAKPPQHTERGDWSPGRGGVFLEWGIDALKTASWV